MTKRILLAAITASSALTSGLAWADENANVSSNDSSNVSSNIVTSALANGTITGEVYVGFFDKGYDLDNSSAASGYSASDIELDELRLGYSTRISDSTELGIEIELESDDVIYDLFVAKSINDTTTITAGRFKQIASRDAAIERSDNPLTTSVSLLDIAAEADDTTVNGYALDDLALLTAGFARRVDGVELKTASESGLNGTFSLYKGGNDSTDGDFKRNFGLAGSTGWQAIGDERQYGFTAAWFLQDGDQSDTSNSADSHGYSFTANLATEFFAGSITYAGSEVDVEQLGVTTTNDVDGITIAGVINLYDAQRSTDQYGILQRPTALEDELSCEAGFNISTTSIDDGTNTIDVNTISIAFNAYYGAYTKLYITWSEEEWEFDGGKNYVVDQLAIGARLDF